MSKALITASTTGSSTTGYTTRPLTTIQYQLNPDGTAAAFATLAANQVTLLAGTYRIFCRAKASGAAADTAYMRLFNVTDAAAVANTEDGQQIAVLNENVDLFFATAFTLAGTKTFALQGFGSAAAANGFGITPVGSVSPILASLEILKTA